MLTRKENLRRVLAGQTPAWVPFALNFAQWFAHHQKFGPLPAELAGCGDYLDAMKALGCDIFSRNLDGGVRRDYGPIKPEISVESAATGPRTTTIYHTPYGALRSVWQEQTALSTSHEEEYFVKDWASDGDAFRWLIAHSRSWWDREAFARANSRLGDDGILNVPCFCTPLKMLHLNFGLEYSCLFTMDYSSVAKQLCDEWWGQTVRPVLETLAADAEVESVCLMDNVDSPFYTPELAEEYWTPYVAEAASLLRRHGKSLFVHACGKLKALAPAFAASRVSGLEGVSHPPLGDWTQAEARACHPDFIFVGGFSAHEQETFDGEGVRAFYADYLPKTDKRRFIFSSSCQTSIGTRWERIKLVREVCRAWGGDQR